jgi:lyso-ornithine lipid O-acyltransferase
MFVWTAGVIFISLPNRLRGWNGIRATSKLVCIWGKGVARISGISVKTYGKMPADVSGLVISNHLSYVDIVVHASIFPLRFTPSTDVGKMPIVGTVTAMSNALFVDRTSATSAKKTARNFIKTMRKGLFLIVYPEATSTDGKRGILPFKSTPFDAASEGNMPVIPILTRYKEKSSEPEIPWYGDMTFFPHFWTLLGSKSIEAEVLFLDPIEPGEKSRKELAAYTHEVMSKTWEEWNKK